jgi:hypothetical protein
MEEDNDYIGYIRFGDLSYDYDGTRQVIETYNKGKLTNTSSAISHLRDRGVSKITKIAIEHFKDGDCHGECND